MDLQHFKVPDSKMLDVANDVASALEEDLALFTAKDPKVDAGFLTDFQAAVRTAEKDGGARALEGQLRMLTADV